MRQSIRGIVARLRERDRVHDAVGLSRLEPESVAVCDALLKGGIFPRRIQPRNAEYSCRQDHGQPLRGWRSRGEGGGQPSLCHHGNGASRPERFAPEPVGPDRRARRIFYRQSPSGLCAKCLSLRTNRAQDPRAPFVAAFIHELVSEGRHHHLGGLVLTNNRRIDFRAGLEISGRRAAMILKGRCYRP